jgi:hypothetical protein
MSVSKSWEWFIRHSRIIFGSAYLLLVTSLAALQILLGKSAVCVKDAGCELVDAEGIWLYVSAIVTLVILGGPVVSLMIIKRSHRSGSTSN